MKSWIRAGLTAIVLMAGVQTQAALLVRDEFNTTDGPDYANGLYKSGSDIGDSAGNATCTGGTLVGFDGTTAWDSASYFDAYANLLRLLHRTYGATYEGREITADLSGESVAYAHTHMRMRSSAASASSAYAYAGFGSNGSLGSAGGATVGFNWDNANSEWDLALRYNNGTTAVATTIQNGITVDSIIELFWKMDADNHTISVWVDNNDYSTAADLTVTDWGGSIAAINHMTAGFAETGSGDVFVYEMELGQTGEDVGMVSETVSDLVAYDGFVTSSESADPANGVYKSGTDLSDAVNKDVTGGTIVGFGGTNSWVASAYYDAYAQKVRLVGRTSSTAAWANRPLTESLAGESEVYASLVLRVADNADAGGQVLAGFSTSTMSNTVGSAVGYHWDGSSWDMVLRYRNASGVVLATIREDIVPDRENTFYWYMNSGMDTINVWVNETNVNALADLTVTDWQGSVADITDFVSSLHKTGSGNNAYLDTIQLGRTAEAIGMTAAPVSGFLFCLPGAPDTDLYVSPSALGTGSGVSADNAAAYTNTVFWSRVQEALASAAVSVTLLDGNYQDGVSLSSLGDADHLLTLVGESADGVLFDGTGSSVQLDLAGCQNVVVENLNFTGDGSGYALRITEAGSLVSSNITVRNCDWYDMTNITYGAAGVHHGSHHVTFDGCSFERIGKSTGSHMIYNAYNADHVSVINSHFEDCAGSYIRFRAGSDYAVVSNCTFVSTQTYAYRSSSTEVFVEFAVFNDADPGDEILPLYATVADNTFTFNSGTPSVRTGIRYYHKGYNPAGLSYLMTASEGAVLEGNNGADKKTLLRDECGLDFDWITISGNTWSSESNRILFGSYAAYGATSQGWDDTADISDIVY